MLTIVSLASAMLVLALCQELVYFDVVVCVVIVFFSIAYIFELTRTKRKYVYGIPLILAYIVRVFLLFYDVYSNDPFNLPLVGGELSSDPLGFYRSAVIFSQGGSHWYGGYFSKLFGLIFYLTKPSRLWAEFIVLLFSVATLHVTASILDKMDITRRVRRNSMYVIGLMPNYLLLSVVFRRETIITFFVSLSLLCLVKWIQGRGKNRSFAFAMIYALLASMFHGGTAMIVVGYIFAYMIYDPRTGKFIMKRSSMIGTVFFTVAFLVFFFRFGTVFFNKFEKLSDVSEIGVSRGAGGSSYARYVGDARSPVRMLIYTIPRYLYFMFSPFPWQWRGVTDIITFLMSSFFYLYVTVSALMFVKKTDKENRKRNAVLVLLMAALLIAFVFSWGVTNTGTATRHRDKFIVLYTLIFALTRKTSKKAINERI